jgi:hypothetical protein
MAEEPGTGAHFLLGLMGKMRGLFTTAPEAGGLGGTGHRGAANKTTLFSTCIPYCEVKQMKICAQLFHCIQRDKLASSQSCTYTVTRPYAGFRHPDRMSPDQMVRGEENDYPILSGNLLP